MKLWSVDIRIYATAYIKADSAKEALLIARALNGDCLEIPDIDGDPPICSLKFNEQKLPAVSLSPMMTIHGPDKNDKPLLVEND